MLPTFKTASRIKRMIPSTRPLLPSTAPYPPPHLELPLQPVHRASAHEHPELPWLHDELHVPIVEAELLRRQQELDRTRLAGPERDVPQGGKRTHGSRDARYLVPHIQLDDFGEIGRASCWKACWSAAMRIGIF